MSSTPDIYFAFGGDTAALEAAAAVVKRQTDSLSTEMRKMAKEFSATGAAADSELGKKLRDLGGQLSTAKQQLSSLQEMQRSLYSALDGGGGHGGHGGAGASFYTREFRALWDELSSGRAHQAVGTASRLFFTFAEGNAALAASVGGFLAVAAAIGYLVYEATVGAKAAQTLRDALNFSGTEIAGNDISDIAAKVNAMRGLFSGISSEEASKMLTAFGAMKGGSAEAFRAILADVESYAEATGQKIPEAAATLTKLFEDPAAHINDIKSLFSDLTEEERAQIDAISGTLDVTKQQAALQQILAAHIQRVVDARLKDVEALLEWSKAQQSLDTEGGASLLVSRYEAQKAALKEIADGVRKHADGLAAAAPIADNLAGKMHDLVEQTLPWAKAIDDATKKLQQAQGALEQLSSGALSKGSPLKGATEDAAAMIKAFERFKDTAYWDVNHYRIGYGSDTQNGQAVAEGTTTTREAAEADLAQRINAIQAQLEQEIGASWERLSGHAKASLIDMAYNYGDLAKKRPGVIAAAQAGDEDALAQQIRGAAADNGGVNAGRRNSEADNILAGQLLDVTKQQKQAIVEANDARAGGTAMDRAELDILRGQIAGQRDSVGEAEKRLASAKEFRSMQETAAAQQRADLLVARAENELVQQRNALKRSELELAKSRAQDGDYKAQRDAAVALADFQMSLAHKGSAEYNAALKEKEDAERTYAETVRKDDEATEDARYQNQIKGLDERRSLLQQQKQDHQITAMQMLASELAIDDQRAAAEKAHWEKIKEIWGDGTNQYRDAVKRMAEIDQQTQNLRVKDIAAADKEIQKDYQRAFESIGNTVSSSIMGMITGHETLRQATAKVVESILGQFISANVKMVADWMAAQAKRLVVGEMTETGLVAANAAGTATRTATTAAGAAAGAAAEKASNATTISGDAAKAAAGAYASVAQIPIVGPVLAPAAAAVAFGAVEAFGGGFAQGSWETPRSGVALIHQGEMIVPAGQTSWAQSLMANAAGGGASSDGGGVTHVHNWNISTNDAASFMQQLGNVASPLAKMIAKTFDANPGVRPKFVG